MNLICLHCTHNFEKKNKQNNSFYYAKKKSSIDNYKNSIHKRIALGYLYVALLCNQ